MTEASCGITYLENKNQIHCIQTEHGSATSKQNYLSADYAQQAWLDIEVGFTNN